MKMTASFFLYVFSLILHCHSQESPIILPVQKGEFGQCHTFEDILQGSGESVKDALKLKLVPECGEGLWREAVFLNMSEPSQQCPSGWALRSSPRSCTIFQQGTCALATFPSGTIFNRVCGRATGIADGSNDAFAKFSDNRVGYNYVDGVTIFLSGVTPQHVWTFATDQTHGTQPRCPCSGSSDFSVPDFVSSNYFCDTNSESNVRVWDGEGCTAPSCCDYNSPPWFRVTLPALSSSYFEVRVCTDEDGGESVSVEKLQLYVQ